MAKRTTMYLNWWVILVPGLLLNAALWYWGRTSSGNRVLAVLYSLALVLYIARRLWHGVPDGYLEITLSPDADPSTVYVPQGTEFWGAQGDVMTATRGSRVARWRIWWARWRGQAGPRRFSVPVRRR